MKKKTIFAILIGVICLALFGYLFITETKMSAQDIFAENGIDFNACMDEATLIKVYVPSENIGKYDKKYAEEDRIVCLLDNQAEIDAFVEVCNQATGNVHDYSQDDFDHDWPNLYVFEVYNNEELLFEFRMVGASLVIGKPYTSKYYKFGENVQLFDYIHMNYDKEQFKGYSMYQ